MADTNGGHDPNGYDEQHLHPRLRFDPTVNLGHIMTFIGFLLTMFVGWTTLDRRVAIVEAQQSHQSQIMTLQTARFQDEVETMRTSQQRIEDAIQRIYTLQAEQAAKTEHGSSK